MYSRPFGGAHGCGDGAHGPDVPTRRGRGGGASQNTGIQKITIVFFSTTSHLSLAKLIS